MKFRLCLNALNNLRRIIIIVFIYEMPMLLINRFIGHAFGLFNNLIVSGHQNYIQYEF